MDIFNALTQFGSQILNYAYDTKIENLCFVSNVRVLLSFAYCLHMCNIGKSFNKSRFLLLIIALIL